MPKKRSRKSFEEEEVSDEENFESMSLTELKAECKKKKLPVSGTKRDLIARLGGAETNPKSPSPKRKKKEEPITEEDQPLEEDELELLESYCGENSWIPVNSRCYPCKFLVLKSNVKPTAKELKKQSNYDEKNKLEGDIDLESIHVQRFSNRSLLVNTEGRLIGRIKASTNSLSLCKEPLWTQKLDKVQEAQVYIYDMLNIPYLEFLVEHGLHIPGRTLISNLIFGKRSKRLPAVNVKDLNVPNVLHQAPTPEKQPDGMKIKLYEYQLHCVSWMKHLENSERKWELSSYFPFPKSWQKKAGYSTQMLCDPLSGRFCLPQHKRPSYFSSRGGRCFSRLGVSKDLLLSTYAHR
jgi:hypothetical protein